MGGLLLLFIVVVYCCCLMTPGLSKSIRRHVTMILLKKVLQKC